MPITVEEIIERLRTMLSEAITALREAKITKPVQAAMIIYIVVRSVVLAIEDLAQELGGIPGEQKRQAAIEFINKHVNIPVLPEWVEAMIIGEIVDFVVAEFNELYGHRWARDLIKQALILLGLLKRLLG